MEEPKYKKYLNGLSEVLNTIDKPGATEDTDRIISSVLDKIKNSQPALLNSTKKYIKGLKKLTRKKFKYYELIWTPEDKKNEEKTLATTAETAAKAVAKETEAAKAAEAAEAAKAAAKITQQKLGGPEAVAKRIEAARKIKEAAEAAKAAAPRSVTASPPAAPLSAAAKAAAAKAAAATAPPAPSRGGSRKSSKATKKRLTHKLARARK